MLSSSSAVVIILIIIDIVLVSRIRHARLLRPWRYLISWVRQLAVPPLVNIQALEAVKRLAARAGKRVRTLRRPCRSRPFRLVRRGGFG